jgi:tetratricopeptide (TPR) repeat protein
MRITMWAALLAGLSGNAMPCAAAAAAATQASEKPSPEEQVSTFMRHFYGQEFEPALRAASAIEVDPANKAGRGIVLGMEAAALLGLKRKDEAQAAYQKADALAPDEPLITDLRMMAALMTSETIIAIESFDRMIARYPDAVRNVDQEIVWFLLRQDGDEQTKQDRRIALARLGYGGEVGGDYLAATAIKALTGRGDSQGALELLLHVDQPVELENLLIQKRYATLWPAIEAHAGPNLSKARRTSVEAAERAYNEQPDEWERLADLANAYRYSERFDEAIALRSKLPLSPDALARAEEQAGWAINNVALAMHSAGKPEDADQLFATLNDANLEKGGWRVSMVINRLELLVGDERYDRAAALLDVTEKWAKENGNPYSQQLVRRLRYCTMAKLGRKDEAARVKTELLKHLDDARARTIDGLLCAGDFDDAEKAVLEGLQDQDFVEEFVRSMQRMRLISDDPSMWSTGWQALRSRPAIAKEFERVGRELPQQFRRAPTS